MENRMGHPRELFNKQNHKTFIYKYWPKFLFPVYLVDGPVPSAENACEGELSNSGDEGSAPVQHKEVVPLQKRGQARLLILDEDALLRWASPASLE